MCSKIKRIITKVKKEGIVKPIERRIRNQQRQKEELKIIRKYHLIEDDERKRQREEVFDQNIKISVITPLYNTPENYLIQLIESVLNQTYTNWELCLADGSDAEHAVVRTICQQYAEKDARIVYRKLDKNEGIVGNTNRAIHYATGDYLGLLDHDDILHESALYECAKRIRDGADFIFTDEMKFRESIEDSSDIVCKSGFGKDELRSHNYICHFVVFARKLLDGMSELYRKECEGSQDYDMVLRLTEKAEKIVHVPKILYYWRVHAGSVSMDLSVKQYAVDAAKKAISNHLERTKEYGQVECNLPYQTIYRIKYDLENTPVVSIYIWENRQEDIGGYIDKLLKKTHYRPLEIICDCKEVKNVADPNVKIICHPQNDEENSYEWMKKARKHSTGKYHICLSGYCMPVSEDWVEEMLMYAQRPDVGIVSANIWNGQNQSYFAGGVLDRDSATGIHVINSGIDKNDQGYEADMRHVRNMTTASRICMMISEGTFEKAGEFEPEMKDCADIDLCLNCVKNGLWNVWACFAEVNYYGENKIEEYWKQNDPFKKKWEKEIDSGDEFYHPLLKALKKI